MGSRGQASSLARSLSMELFNRPVPPYRMALLERLSPMAELTLFRFSEDARSGCDTHGRAVACDSA